MILKQKSINFLNQHFKLPAIGTEQDWAIELADHTRIKAFLDSYNTITLSSDDKIALMALVFASYEDYIYKYGKEINIENKMEKIKQNKLALGKDTDPKHQQTTIENQIHKLHKSIVQDDFAQK